MGFTELERRALAAELEHANQRLTHLVAEREALVSQIQKAAADRSVAHRKAAELEETKRALSSQRQQAVSDDGGDGDGEG